MFSIKRTRRLFKNRQFGLGAFSRPAFNMGPAFNWENTVIAALKSHLKRKEKIRWIKSFLLLLVEIKE